MNTLSFFTTFFTKLVRTITLSRVFMWAFVALTVISSYTLYENRTKLLSFITAPSPTNMVGMTFTVGQETKDRVTVLVGGDSRIAGIAVMSTDLRLNEAKALYFYGDNPNLVTVFNRSIEVGSNRLPMFTNNDESNAQIIKLINGQFVCVPFEKALISKIYPELSPSVKTICRSSIPSYYGYFSGYVEAYLSEVPSPEREQQYKLLIEKLANEVYFRDVIETQRPEKVVGERRGG